MYPHLVGGSLEIRTSQQKLPIQSEYIILVDPSILRVRHSGI
jgi:hypothetical protein